VSRKDRLFVLVLVVAAAVAWPRVDRAADAQSRMMVDQGAPSAQSAPWPVTLVPAGNGPAWQKAKYTAQTTTLQTVKAVAGEIGGWYISNTANAASSCVQFFDTPTGQTPVLGTTSPDMVLELPASSASNWMMPAGVQFRYAIKFAVATTCTGNTAPSSGLNLTLFYY
jgi:hypothetical protein